MMFYIGAYIFATGRFLIIGDGWLTLFNETVTSGCLLAECHLKDVKKPLIKVLMSFRNIFSSASGGD